MNAIATVAVTGSPDLVAESRDVLARHARSFQLASRFLPADVRDDAALCYAFCRMVDDAVDETADPVLARRAAEDLLDELKGRRAPRPVVLAWRHMALRRRIPGAAAYALLEGALADTGEVRLEDDAALVEYGYLVAGTVGVMMCGLLGVRDRDALPHAIDLGIGMQLTNICRDVREDAARGRVYLPRTRLLAHGTTPEAVLDGTAPRAAVAAVVLEVLDLAERYYASAEQGMRAIPWRARLAIYAASRLYAAIGRKLARSGGDALAGRTVVGPWERAWCVVRAVAAWGWSHLARGAETRHDASLHLPIVGRVGVRHAGTV